MFKFMPVFKARAELGREEAALHYRQEHGRLAASVGEFNRHMIRYVQNLAIPGTGPAGAVDVLGVSECWFLSIEGFWSAFAEPRYAEFRTDEARFIAMDDLLLVPALPNAILGNATPMPLKLMRFASFREGVDRDAAKVFWETEHAGAVACSARIRTVAATYVQNRKASAFEHNFPAARECDIAEEYWIAHIDHFRELVAAEAALRVETGFDEFIDTENRIEFLADSKLMWETGEAPANALARLDAALDG